MKSIERQIVETVMVIILIAGFIALCATSVVAQKVQIKAMSLSDLIGSDDEIECFAQFFDTKREIISLYIADYRHVYEDELRNAGYNVKDITNHINFVIPFDKNGHIVKWEDFTDPERHEWDLPRAKIIGRHHEKVVFHYEIEE